MSSANFSTSQEAQQAAALLEGYRFELGNHDAAQWVSLWMEFYRPIWIRDAIVEALYQGRYKSRSVRQILELWDRRGQPIRHASHDFEAAICREFGGAKLTAPAPIKSANPQIRREPTLRRASQRTHQSLSSISFNLAEESKKHADRLQAAEQAAEQIAERDRTPFLDAPSQQNPLKETTETLQEQQQNGVLFRSARAIQPFKPALPFSAQTLRLAKQKALALSERAPS